MDIALCHENVLPARGGCETYIADFTRRLARDGHQLHLYASRWDEAALPANLHYHMISQLGGPRFLRPWRFAAACERAIHYAGHDVTIGFDKTWGQDVLYPQGGLHAASVEHNVRKHAGAVKRLTARLTKALDPAARSFCRLERRQYHENRPEVMVANSEMVRGHFQKYLGIAADRVRVVHAAIDPSRFQSTDRPEIRSAIRAQWQVGDNVPVALFVAMNYRLKGLEPLLHAVSLLPSARPFRLVVVGNPRVARYERLARRLGVADRVTFHGFCADARTAYFASDFLVHPTFYDPCSLVVLEALACGLPAITTRYNGAAELLHPPHDGLVIADPHDHASLAKALGQMLEREYRAEASREALNTSRQWTFDDHYRKMVLILQEAAARRHSSRAA